MQAEKSGVDEPMPELLELVPAPLVEELLASDDPEAPLPPMLEPVPGVVAVAAPLPPVIALPVPPALEAPLGGDDSELPAPALEEPLRGEAPLSRFCASRATQSPKSLPVRPLHAAAGVEAEAPGEPDMLSLDCDPLAPCAKANCAPAKADTANAIATAREMFPIV